MERKPWEEYWTCVRYEGDQAEWWLVARKDPAGTGDTFATFDRDGDGPRARLAAAAPEMARMLLSLTELSRAVPGGVDEFCPTCSGNGGAPGSYLAHRDGCPLVALLRKAGVVE